MRLTKEYTLDIEHRFKYATIAVLVLFFVIAARLYYLQVIKGNFYRFFSTENSIKEIKIPAMRGMMFDRRGNLLVENRPSFAVTVTPQYVEDPERMIDSLSKLLKMPREEIEEAWNRRNTAPSYQPLKIKTDVSHDEAALVRSRRNPLNQGEDEMDLRGVDVEIEYKREYPDSNIATHVLGYVKEIDVDRLKRYKEKYPNQYKVGDQTGIEGLEYEWDQLLKGTDGYEMKVVNAVGREVYYEGMNSEAESRAATPGASLTLTIDRDLQKVIRDAFGEKKGAAVAIDVKTGGVLAMFSAPSYDLNRFTGADASKYWSELSQSPEKALINRAIAGGFPPGSTYKVVNAIASLSEGVITPDEKLRCGGALMYGGRAYHCWRKGGHGAISLHKSLVSSCDVYYYLTGLRLGVDRLAKYAKMFGLGHKTGIDLLGERSGLVPTSEWKQSRFGIPWQEGETLSISVGQGYNIETPIQNAYLAAQIANGGQKLGLHLVEEAHDSRGALVYKWQPGPVERLDIEPEVFKVVKDAMVGVVAEGDGTAHAQSAKKVTMGGKTGTAQVVQLDSGIACRGEKCRDHAWFIGFSPADEPKIAAAVIVEHGGFGAAAAAPIVGAIFERYYELEKEKK